jgi:predicted RNA-binding Zn-ribbon protein involved in translation (DUF1610 family)
MSMRSHARACGMDPDAMFNREYESEHPQYHRYECNICGGSVTLARYRANYVCPWCGEGVIQRQE